MPPPLNPLGAVLCCAGWNQVWRQQRPAADAAPTYRSRDSVASCICCSLARSLASSRKAQTRLQHLQRTAAAPVTVSVSVSAAESVGRLNHMIAIMCKPPEKSIITTIRCQQPQHYGLLLRHRPHPLRFIALYPINSGASSLEEVNSPESSLQKLLGF